ncbi:MAG: carbohydrate-binding family 9-like protein [Deltaproteobacteria bacterium]|nr:carbohydrate-binding family 9-like protein [Deltaproteobacteria bacterium]
MNGRSLVLVSLLAILLVVPGCKKPRKTVLSKDQREEIGSAILSEAPTPQIPINAVLDGKIRLIGADLSSATVKAGESFQVTWYWEALEDLGGSWKIFVHFEAPGKRSVHDHQAVGELYPLSRWKKGEIIKDVQTIPVPKDFPAAVARLFVGVFDEAAWSERQANVRMTVTNKDEMKVPLDNDGRIEGAKVTVTTSGASAAPSRAKLAAAREPERELTVARVEAAPTIDGKLDDPAWQTARPGTAFVQPGGGGVTPQRMTQVRAVWDDSALYVAFTVRDDDVWNDQTGRDATLWEQDVVEIYLDPGADGRDYVELQVSPTGEIFDAWFETHRTPAWPEAAKKLTLSGMQAKVEVDGSVNQRDDGVTDKGWNVEVAIPWKELPGIDGAPAPGTRWGANFYRIDVKSPAREGFMTAWSPAGGDFHNTSQFGRLVFAPATAGRASRANPAAAGGPGEEEGAGEEAPSGAAPTPAGGP